MGRLMVEVHLQPLHAAVTHLHLSAKVMRCGFYALLTASCLRIGGVVLQVSIQGLIILKVKLQLDALGIFWHILEKLSENGAEWS